MHAKARVTELPACTCRCLFSGHTTPLRKMQRGQSGQPFDLRQIGKRHKVQHDTADKPHQEQKRERYAQPFVQKYQALVGYPFCR